MKEWVEKVRDIGIVGLTGAALVWGTVAAFNPKPIVVVNADLNRDGVVESLCKPSELEAIETYVEKKGVPSPSIQFMYRLREEEVPGLDIDALLLNGDDGFRRDLDLLVQSDVADMCTLSDNTRYQIFNRGADGIIRKTGTNIELTQVASWQSSHTEVIVSTDEGKTLYNTNMP